MTTEIYAKYPLGSSSTQIRLLRLLPGSLEEVVTCELLVASLTNLPVYEAVSYSWGDPKQTLPIFLGSVQKPVTLNLYSFLRSRRSADSPLSLWIDAICINQEDPNEKGHQVAAMKQIYAKASSLSIWLGDPVADTELAFFTLDNLVDNAYWRISRDGKKEAVLNILNRPWWERVWVIQELVAFGLENNATSVPVMRCGSYTMLWSDLITAANNMIDTDPKYDMPVSYARKIKDLERIRQTFLTTPDDSSLRLGSLMRWCRSWKSTDPRDKIYALLGIAHQPNEPADTIEPNYKKTMDVLFRQFAKQEILQSQKLHLLCHCQKKESRTLPSWVPDWTTELICPTLLSEEDDHSFDSEYGEMEKDIEWSATGTSLPRISFSENPSILRAEGLLVDEVVLISDLFMPNFSDDDENSPNQEYWRVYVQNLVILAKVQEEFVGYSNDDDPYEDFNARKYAFWNAVFANRVTVEAVTDTDVGQFNYQNWLPRKPAHWEPKIPDVPEQFYGSMIELSGVNDFDIRAGPLDVPRFLDVFLHYRESTLSLTNSLFDLKYLYNRRLFLTRMGYIGLGPGNTAVRDSLVLLLGSDVPFLLHPKSNGQHHELLGEAYVWGLMDGEILEDFSAGGLQAGTFNII